MIKINKAPRDSRRNLRISKRGYQVIYKFHSLWQVDNFYVCLYILERRAKGSQKGKPSERKITWGARVLHVRFPMRTRGNERRIDEAANRVNPFAYIWHARDVLITRADPSPQYKIWFIYTHTHTNA